MRARFIPLLPLLGAIAVACSSSIVASDASADHPAPQDSPGITDAPAPPTDAPAPPTDVPAARCPPGNVCLLPRVPVAGNVIVAGRLAVVWFQINDDGPDPAPQVAYDVPFSGAATRVDIPLAAITAPGEQVLYCARACNDEAMCPCIGGPRLGFAYVIVAVDRDANGRTDVSRTGGSSDPIVAAGFTVVVLSPSAMPVASAPLDMLFTAGIAAGTAPYGLIPGSSTRNVLGAPDPSRVYDLNFCPPESSACRAYVPDIN